MTRPALAAAALAALLLAGCGETRKATESTGTAKATITTKAPASEVSDSALQQQAQSAATAASTPVAGMNATSEPPVSSTTVTNGTTTTTTTTDHTGR